MDGDLDLGGPDVGAGNIYSDPRMALLKNEVMSHFRIDAGAANVTPVRPPPPSCA